VAQICTSGQCECHTAYTDCSGLCVNLKSDVLNCGSCGNVCPSGQICKGGTCQTQSP
jgi:hypothetical protein